MEKYEPCPHTDCIYRNPKEKWTYSMCDYITMTGKSRIKGLTPEQAADKRNCPKYEHDPGKPTPAKRRRNEKRDITRELEDKRSRTGSFADAQDDRRKRLRALYDSGFYDKKIAEEMGISVSGVKNWRKRNRLPANREPAPTRYDWDKGITLYHQGLSDAAIARELGCRAHTVTAWRGRRELPPNFPAPGKKKT